MQIEDVCEYVYNGRLLVRLDTTKAFAEKLLEEFKNYGGEYKIEEEDFDVMINIDPNDYPLLDAVCEKYSTPYTL